MTLCGIQVNNSIRPSEKKVWNAVSAAILNSGGIRSSIDERYNKGENPGVAQTSSWSQEGPVS